MMRETRCRVHEKSLVKDGASPVSCSIACICTVDSTPGGLMNRLLSLVALTILLLHVAACSSTKPPAPSAVQGSKVITTLKDLSTMYGKKNLPGFMSMIAAGYKDRKDLSSAVE